MSITISVREFAQALDMTVSVNTRPTFTIGISDISFPGLQLAGYFAHFDHIYDRVQLAGNAEMVFFNDCDSEVLAQRLKQYFSYDIPLIVVARGNPVPTLLANMARDAGVPVLRSRLTTTKCAHQIAAYLDDKLAPTETRHGVLLDVHGVGVMLTGESGVGKSETALELIKRGHRLVTDDVVEMRKLGENMVVGRSPELIRYLMELRGVGIIDVCTMYGISAVLPEKQLDMIIHLEDWDETKSYDRLGLHDNYMKILGVSLPYLTVPVRPGRNLAIIVEVASRNFRLKKSGFSAAQELDRRIRQQAIDTGEMYTDLF